MQPGVSVAEAPSTLTTTELISFVLCVRTTTGMRSDTTAPVAGLDNVMAGGTCAAATVERRSARMPAKKLIEMRIFMARRSSIARHKPQTFAGPAFAGTMSARVGLVELNRAT